MKIDGVGRPMEIFKKQMGMCAKLDHDNPLSYIGLYHQCGHFFFNSLNSSHQNNTLATRERERKKEKNKKNSKMNLAIWFAGCLDKFFAFTSNIKIPCNVCESE